MANSDDGESFLVTMLAAGKLTLTAKAGARRGSVELTITNDSPVRFAAGEKRYKNDTDSGAACASCHVAGDSIDHSPAAIAAAPDASVRTVITTGILREGNPIRGVNHKWQVMDAELDGLVTYLRALPPRGYTVGR
jgi:mono/diheme cytochrome c family protein